MLKTKIAVLSSGGGTNLQALLDAQKSGVLKDGEISVVISNNENAYALTRAKEHGIPVFALPKKKMSQEEFEEKLLDILREHEIELTVLAGFMCILSADFIASFSGRIINVHPALIPSFCGKGFYGLRVHEAALEYGVKITGATVHFVNEIPDGGEIILQKAVKVLKGDTPQSLQKRVMEKAEWVILPKAAQMVSRLINAERDCKNDA